MTRAAATAAVAAAVVMAVSLLEGKYILFSFLFL